MSQHLKTCWDRLSSAPSKVAGRWYLLAVQGRYASQYWLYLQAAATSTFGDLDAVLRAIWLECCDHLSDFEFPVKRPRLTRGVPLQRAAMLASLFQEDLDPMADTEAVMGEALATRLQPGVEFIHRYDYGTTTQLSLHVAAEFARPAMDGAIKVLARNGAPPVACDECSEPATQLCVECDCALCTPCGAHHECGEERLAPLINSPRAGICGYCGPSREP